MSPSPNQCGVRGWRRVTFQTAQYPVVTCWSVTEAFVFGFLYVVLACLIDLELPYQPFFCSGVLGKLTLGSRGYFFLIDTDGSRRSHVNQAHSAEEPCVNAAASVSIRKKYPLEPRVRETLVVSKVLGGFFFSSETVNYRLMGNCSDGADRKFEVSEQLPWFHRSVLKGTEKRATKKRATCFATLLQNELNTDAARFTTHIKPVLQQIRLLTGLNVGGKTRNNAIQRVLQQCYKKSCTFFVARFSVPAVLWSARWPRWRGFPAKLQYR